MTPWRLLKDNITDPLRHFAVEEAVMQCVDENKSPNTLRIRMVEPSVFIGFYQHPEEDTDIAYCKNHGIKIIRRMNPGGAVYQDEGTFCYSAFFKKSVFQKIGIKNTDELYTVFGEAVIKTLELYDVKAKLSPVNDITVNNRKLYGSAQLDWYSVFVHSGSFLINVNMDRIEKTLKPSSMKFADKGFTNVKDRVINLSELINENVNIEEFQNRFIKQIAEVLNVEFHTVDLTEEEKELSEILYQKKYGLKDWTFSKQRSYTRVLSKKIKSGVLMLSVNSDYGIIKNMNISGDFLIADTTEITQLENELQNCRYTEAEKIVDRFKLPEDIKTGILSLLKSIQ